MALPVELACVLVLASIPVRGYAALYGSGAYLQILAGAVVAGMVAAFVAWLAQAWSGAWWFRLIVTTVALPTVTALTWSLLRPDAAASYPIQGLSDSARAILTRNQPVDLANDVLAVPFLLTALATALALLAIGSESAVRPLLPVATAFGAQLLLCAGIDRQSVLSSAGFAGAAVVLVGARYGRLGGAGIRGGRWQLPALAGTVAVVVVSAGATAWATSGLDRRDPRDRWQHNTTAQRVTPLALVRAELAGPDAARFSITYRGPRTASRVMVARLDVFDGAAWTTRPEFRMAGTVLSPHGSFANGIRADVKVTALPGVLLPVPGRPVRVDRASEGDLGKVLFDRQSGMLLARSIAAPTRYGVTGADSADQGESTPNVQDCQVESEPLAMGELRRKWLPPNASPAGLDQLADRMKADLPYNPQGPAGSSLGSIQRVLSGTGPANAGNAEQHAAALSYLACAAGRPARVVVGYRLPGVPVPNQAQIVTAHDVHAWSEVWFGRQGWITFDPTDPDKTVTAPVTGVVPPVQPSPAPTPTVTLDPPRPGPTSPPPPGVAERLASLIRTVYKPALLLAVIVAAVLFLGLLLLRVRSALSGWRDRARWQRALEARRTAPEARERVLGAWESAKTSLRKGGLPLRHSSTPDEVAELVSVRLPRGAAPMRRLAQIVNATSFGPHAPPQSDADLAWILTDEMTRLATQLGESSVGGRK